MNNEQRARRTPMLGAAYYPETWDEAEQDYDIAKMVESGCNVMRMTEFAWHKMEPREGEFDFSWLHRVMDKLWAAGIATMLGTPSATPPRWLEKKDPSMYVVFGNGMQTVHGARRNCCSNNPTYRAYSVRIAEAMAKEFGDDPRVIGWQIDNEMGLYHEGCYCEHCRRGFTEYLREAYGTVENLNEQWNLEAWSQYYDAFEDIPAPFSGQAWHHPNLRLEWRRFQSRSHEEFIRLQADVLHRYTKAPVGTDMMATYDLMDYNHMASFLDVMQFNHYHEERDLWEVLIWFDYLRTFKDRPFWNTETSTCWNGADFIPSLIRKEGFCRALSWLPVAMGGEANLYWLWRQHRAGHELMHGAVLYANGRPMHIFGEVQQIAAEYERCAEFINGTTVKTDVAMMVDADNARMQSVQLLYPDDGKLYNGRVATIHTGLWKYGLRPDVIAHSHTLADYKVLLTPFMMSMEREGLRERLAEWIQAGGTWIAGPITDIRNAIGGHYLHAATGFLEEWTGAKLTDQIPDKDNHVTCSFQDGSPFSAYGMLQLFEVPEDCEVLASVTGGVYPSLGGKVLAFRKPFGRGQIIVLGTTPDEAGMAQLLDVACRHTTVRRFAIEGNLTVVPRAGVAGEGLAVVEHRGEPASLTLEEPMTDLISGRRCEGKVDIAPFDVLILKK